MWPEPGRGVPRAGLVGARTVASAWLDVTRWWAEALVAVPGRLPRTETALLARLVGDFAHVHRGRQVGFDIGGRPVRARLEAIALEPGRDRTSGRVVLRDVAWDGLRLDPVTVLADRVALRGPPALSFVATDLEVHATCAVEELVGRLASLHPDRHLAVTDGALVEWSRPGRRTRYVVDAWAHDGELRVELRAVRWCRWSLRVPGWLRLTRRVPAPALPGGARLAEARRDGHRVQVRVLVASVEQAIDRQGPSDRGGAAPLAR